MDKFKLFDIHYQTSDNKPGIVKGVNREDVKCEFDRLFENENMFLACITKYDTKDVIFSHSVLSGTKIREKEYRPPSIKRKGEEAIKLGLDGVRQVNSKYPRWSYGVFEYCDGELNIEKLLENIE